ncbi:hypothetical protein SDC9_74174 [bioreactor metagenome]|uniref:Uncharacterized protein n=1 Tax=bioreactor metagenome TaxID=1076179 RepID=A0A644YIE6_9ZZZZ
MLADDIFLQHLLIGIDHFSMSFFLHGVSLSETDAPFKEQPQLCPHGMGAGFHHDKAALWNGFQFVRCHERALHHLQGLAGVILTTTHAAAHDRAAAQCFTQHFGGLAVGGKAAKDGVLAIVHDYF